MCPNLKESTTENENPKFSKYSIKYTISVSFLSSFDKSFKISFISDFFSFLKKYSSSFIGISNSLKKFTKILNGIVLSPTSYFWTLNLVIPIFLASSSKLNLFFFLYSRILPPKILLLISLIFYYIISSKKIQYFFIHLDVIFEKIFKNILTFTIFNGITVVYSKE